MSYSKTFVEDILKPKPEGYEKELSRLPQDDKTMVAIAFKDAVCKALRVEAARRNKQSWYIYRDDSPYVLGHVGYWDQECSEESINKYCVSSRLINNDRYSTCRPNHHVKASMHFDTALKTAKTFLRPMSLVELARAHAHTLYTKRGKLLHTAKQEFFKKEHQLLGTNSVIDLERANESMLAKELRHLITIKHAFVQGSRYTEILSDLFGTVDKIRDFVERQDPAHFVHVYHRRGVQMFDTINLIPRQGGLDYKVDSTCEPKIYTSDTIPEDMVAKVATLDMLDKDEYVDEVGLKIGSGMFYVL